MTIFSRKKSFFSSIFAQVPQLSRVSKDVLKTTTSKKKEKKMNTKDDRDALFQETVFMLFALDIAAKLVIYGTVAFCILK